MMSADEKEKLKLRIENMLDHLQKITRDSHVFLSRAPEVGWFIQTTDRNFEAEKSWIRQWIQENL